MIIFSTRGPPNGDPTRQDKRGRRPSISDQTSPTYPSQISGAFVLPGTFNFQCVVEGATARYWAALLAPIVPLLFLLACGVLEMSNHGSGCLAEESLQHPSTLGLSSPGRRHLELWFQTLYIYMYMYMYIYIYILLKIFRLVQHIQDSQTVH